MKQVDFLFPWLLMQWWNLSNTIRSHPAADAQRTNALAEKTHLVTVKIHLWHQADSRGHNQHNESQISNKTLITIHIDIHRYMMLYDVIWISIKMTYMIMILTLFIGDMTHHDSQYSPFVAGDQPPVRWQGSQVPSPLVTSSSPRIQNVTGKWGV